ncbi:PaaI family thioesterase, partial [Roseomonas sp. 18066]|uniref:PaaI family thioesterase n=1 Tax=Roseomonas sp. 18066 TaxID=2681412 RepID=UPI0013598B27
GFTDLVGPLWAKRDGGAWAYGLLAGPQHANVHGIVHGGMLMTLIDNALGLTVWEATSRQPAVTMQLNTQFIAAARPGDFIEARGEVLRVARSVVFVRGILSVRGETVLAADGVWKVISPSNSKKE